MVKGSLHCLGADLNAQVQVHLWEASGLSSYDKCIDNFNTLVCAINILKPELFVVDMVANVCLYL